MTEIVHYYFVLGYIFKAGSTKTIIYFQGAELD